jgi:hypothetical protein
MNSFQLVSIYHVYRNEMGAAVHEWSAWACPAQRISPSALSNIQSIFSKIPSQDKALKSRPHRISLYWFGAESSHADEGLKQLCLVYYADLGICCATHRTIPCTPFSSSGFACGMKGPVIGVDNHDAGPGWGSQFDGESQLPTSRD